MLFEKIIKLLLYILTIYKKILVYIYCFIWILALEIRQFLLWVALNYFIVGYMNSLRMYLFPSFRLLLIHTVFLICNVDLIDQKLCINSIVRKEKIKFTTIYIYVLDLSIWYSCSLYLWLTDKQGITKFIFNLDFRRKITVSFPKPNKDENNTLLNKAKDVETAIKDKKIIFTSLVTCKKQE